jgi:hypothetical protein
MTSYYTPPKFGEKNPFDMAMSRAMKKRSISSDDKDAVKKRLFTEDESSTVEIPDARVWSMENKSVDHKLQHNVKAVEETASDDTRAHRLVIADEGASGGHKTERIRKDDRYA